MKTSRYAILATLVLPFASACGPTADHSGHARESAPIEQRGDEPMQQAEWTCSMHPQIRLPAPGECPICGMDLVRVEDTDPDDSVTLSAGARRIASIQVATVDERVLDHVVRTVGRIELNEREVAYLTARVAGRVERVFADFTGMRVKQGDHLVDLYSPDLTVAQQEYLLVARRRDADPAALELARQKLALLGLTPAQIEHLESSGTPSVVLTAFAPIGGTVIEKNVREQSYVAAGDPLYTIANLATVWLQAEIYEYELPWVTFGQSVDVDVEAVPGETLQGVVAFVDPMVNESTRTIRVRIDLDNPGERLKPGMFASARIHARLAEGGTRAAGSVIGEFACSMHPEIRSNEPGACPICGMALEKDVPSGPAAAALVAVPATAVLDSGLRRIVWVEEGPGRFAARDVKLGPRAGDHYPVLSGVVEGEIVVVHGNFLLDSQAQITGKPCLLFPEGLRATPAHAEHANH
ncbi:MAG: efflux RND transporter periplasmic adaptor subunit [Planctomycetes bacterium]|nr:efflux RND transporter periplasmic adaptor subunit [Planctomycetota bacterium]